MRPRAYSRAKIVKGFAWTRVAFRLARYDRDKASELVKRPVGPRTSSHGGKYVVRGKGLLDEIPHVWLIRAVLIVRRTRRVVAPLGKMGRRCMNIAWG